jgi:transporter family protein
MDYRLWAFGSAIFAGITAVLAKKGVEGVPANLALAIRVAVVLVFAVAIAILTQQADVKSVTSRQWIFLALSGIATGLSWLCYFRALKLGPVAKVAPIDKLSFVLAMVLGVLFLKEKPAPNVWIGAAVIVVGVLITLK